MEDIKTRYVVIMCAIEYMYTSHYDDKSKHGIMQKSLANDFSEIESIVTEFEEKLKTEEDDEMKSIGLAIIRFYREGLREDLVIIWKWNLPMLCKFFGPEIANMMDSAITSATLVEDKNDMH